MVGLAVVDASPGAAFMTDDASDGLRRPRRLLTKVLSLAPNHASAHLLLGLAQMYTKRVTQGIAECEHALALDQNSALCS